MTLSEIALYLGALAAALLIFAILSPALSWGIKGAKRLLAFSALTAATAALLYVLFGNTQFILDWLADQFENVLKSVA